MMKIPTKILKAIRKALNEGKTKKDIAKEFGFSQKDLTDIIKKNLLDKPEPKHDNKSEQICFQREEKHDITILGKQITGFTRNECKYILENSNDNMIESLDYVINLCQVLLRRELEAMALDLDSDDDFSYKIKRQLDETPFVNKVFLANGEEEQINSIKKQLLIVGIEELHKTRKARRDEYTNQILKITNQIEKLFALRNAVAKTIADREEDKETKESSGVMFLIPDNGRNTIPQADVMTIEEAGELE